MAQEGGAAINLFVRTLEHGQYGYSMPSTATVGDLKNRLAESSGIPKQRHRILYRGRELTDDSTALSTLNLSDNAVFHLATRPPPEETQHREERQGGVAGGAAGQGLPTNPQGGGGPGLGLPNLMNLIQGPAVQGFAGGGGTGIGIGLSIGPNGIVAGPGAAELDQLSQALTQMFGQGVPNIRVVAGGRGGGGRGSGRGPAGGRPRVVRGPSPQLDAHGRYNGVSVLQGIDELLVRLQNGNMETDPSHATFFNTPGQVIRAPGQVNAWSQASRAFLQACRTILQSANLNRETLAAVNRVFTAAGMQAIPLGVRSFPISGLASEGGDSEGSPGPTTAAAAPAAAAQQQADVEDDEPPPPLTDSEDHAESEQYSEEDEYYDSEEDYYDSEEEESEREEESVDEWETDASYDSDAEAMVAEAIRSAIRAQSGRGGAAAAAMQGATSAAGAQNGNDSAAAEDGNDSPPPLEDSEGEEQLPGLLVDETASEASDASPPPLTEEGESESDYEPSRTRRRTAIGSSRGGQGSSGGRRRARAGGAESGTEEESLPGLLSDEELSEDDEEWENFGRGLRSGFAPNAAAEQQRAARPGGVNTAWFANVSNDDLVLLAAVTVGELARRFMQVIGQETSPVQVNAMIMRLATRLRSLSSLDGGRLEISRQIRLVSGHLMRVAATAAELGRIANYIGSGISETNMQFLSMEPAFIRNQDGRYMSNLTIMQDFNGTVLAGAHLGPQDVFSRFDIEATLGGGGGGGVRGGAGGSAAQRQAQQQQQQQQRQQPQRAPTAATTQSQATQAPLLRQQGGGARQSTEQEQQQPARGNSSSFSEIMRGMDGAFDALSHLIVTSVDISALSRDIQTALTNSITEEHRQAANESFSTLRSAPSSAAAESVARTAAQIGPDVVSRATQAVEGVLRQHFSQMGENAHVQQYGQQLQELLGVDVSQAFRNLVARGTAAASAGAGAASAATASATAAQQAQQAAPSAPAPATAAAAPAARAPSPAGLGGRGLGPSLPRRQPQSTSAAPTPAASASRAAPQLPPRSSGSAASASGGPSLPPRRTSTTTSTTSAPTPAAGGMGGMLQAMMSNPAVGDLAGQLLGGTSGNTTGTAQGTRSSTSGAAGLDLGGLLNAAGPMLSSLMGGSSGAGGGAPGQSSISGLGSVSGRRTSVSGTSGAGAGASAAAPVDLEGRLSAVLSAEDAARWKEIIEKDQAAQNGGVSGDGGMFSDAYLAAMPPRAASGLLGGLLGDE